MAESEVIALATEVAEMERVDPDVAVNVLKEFEELSRAQKFMVQGGLEFARSVLEETLGAQRAAQVTERLRVATETRGFDNLDKVDVSQLVNFLHHEHPQTIALVMAHLDTRQSAQVLLGLPEAIRPEVVLRIARLDKTTPEMIEQIERQLNAQLATSSASMVASAVGGAAQVAEVLNQVDKVNEEQILGVLAETHAHLAEEIKNLMFVFDDIQTLDDKAIQKILLEIETKDLAVALKACHHVVKEAFFRNLSERARLGLIEDMDFMGPVRVTDVEDAQRRVLDAIRRLEAEGTVQIRGAGAVELVG
jgi:flagellar motor switch protein FliG